MDAKVKPELVRLAKNMSENGVDLASFSPTNSMCACMGPSKGDYLCPCAQKFSLHDNIIEVAAEALGETAAKKIFLRKLVAVLPG